MTYIILMILIIFLLFLFIYPFKVIIHNESNYLYINISNFVVFKLNVLALLDKLVNTGIEVPASNAKVLKKLKFQKIEVKLRGLSFNYRLNGAYYGLLCAIAGFLKTFCETKNIEFNYDFQYLGDEYLEFKSIVRARAYSVIGAINSV